MLLKVTKEEAGLNPAEAVIVVETVDGEYERLVVPERSIRSGGIEVGYPISEADNRYLVELPRETFRGAWRLWVPRSNVFA